MRSALYFFFGFLFLLPSFGYGQVSSAFVLPENLSISLSSRSAEPGKRLVLFLESSSINLSGSEATWYKDGGLLKKGSAKDQVSFIVNGTKTIQIKVAVTDAMGKVTTAIKEITPQSVSLFWQTDGFVPPFYKGRARLGFEGTVTFVPVGTILGRSGQVLSPQNLIYTWKVNGKILGSLSGLGKNTLTRQSDIISRPFEVTLEISSPDGQGLAEAYALVEPSLIDPVIYEDNPLLGLLLERAGTQGLLMQEPEIQAFVVPYFASARFMGDPSVQTVWQINGEAGTESSPWAIRIRQNGDRGLATLTVGVNNPSVDLQSGQGSATVFLNGNK